MKRYAFIATLFIILSGCLSSEAKHFIESSETQTNVKNLVEETFQKEGVPVKVTSDEAIYKPVAKGGSDEEVIRVSYKTINEPVYHSMAFIDVDIESKPRKVDKVSKTGLIDDYEYDLYDALMKYTFMHAHKGSIKELENTEETFENLEFRGDLNDEGFKANVQLVLNKEMLTNDIKHNMFRDYKENKFAYPTEDEAKSLLDTYLFLSVGDDPRLYDSEERTLLPNIMLKFFYNGTFNNEKMDQLLNEILTIDDLPDAFYRIAIQADDFEEKESTKVYNRDVYGELTDSFIGHIRISGDLKESSTSMHFQNEADVQK